MFCPKCESLMMPSEGSMKCSCGYVQADGKLKDKKKKIVQIAVGNEQEENLPVTDAECTKCKNNKAHFWTLQTRSADEPETKFYKCTKCKNIWREYD